VGWSQSADLPPAFQPRWNFSYAYFPPAGQVVLFGGAPKALGESWHNDSWVYQNGQWSAGPAAPAGLRPRGGAAMAYDPDIGRVVLFGGTDDTWPPHLTDTWFYDGSSWQQGPAAPADLTAREGAQMVYDPDIHALVMFGGTGVEPYPETWLFDGSSWRAGPATPSGMSPRIYFGMAYDPVLHRVVVAGGDGGFDVWMFDGTAWTPGPALPSALGPKERFRMDYDPQLGGEVTFSGLGPGMASKGLWILRNGSNWVNVPGSTVLTWAPRRVDGGTLWYPPADALIVFSGIEDGNNGVAGYSDTWLFRDVAPQPDSVTIGPVDPTVGQGVTLTLGPTVAGYLRTWADYRWLVNGNQVAGAFGKLLPAGTARPGDVIQASARLVDALNITGPWVMSNPVTVANRPPTLNLAGIQPGHVYVSSSLSVLLSGMSDPDGDSVTLHFAWTVNGVPAGSDSPKLTPASFREGDTVGLTVTPVDQWGMAGAPVDATPKVVGWNLVAGDDVPGRTIPVRGGGFGSTETVDVHADSATGPLLGSASTDPSGAFASIQAAIPTPFPGGRHMFYGVGRTSGIVGSGPMTVLPDSSINNTALAVSDTTRFVGVGFIPGEQVSIAFPFDPGVVLTADATGTVQAVLTSPPEPAPGGVVTATGPQSGTLTDSYRVVSTFTAPATSEPYRTVPVKLTGFGPLEQATFNFDGGPTSQTFVTDAQGSLSANLLLSTTFKTHVINVAGVSSGMAEKAIISLPGTMSIAPSSGPVGTVVVVDSGPGWVPNETVHLLLRSTQLKNVTADGTGTVHTTFAMPHYLPGASVTVKLCDAGLGLTLTNTFTVTSSSAHEADAPLPGSVR